MNEGQKIALKQHWQQLSTDFKYHDRWARRIRRLLTDLALAQADKQSVRFYAMFVGIMANRKRYYEILEQTQKGDLDITEWIVWFC